MRAPACSFDYRMAMSPRVVLVTRYPEPGRVKTRLIPALGAERAAQLHRALTERAVQAVRSSGLVLELRTTGAPTAAFEEWLGAVGIVDQGEGDLGERLARAGPPYPTIFIGADAPDLTPNLLQRAARALNEASAVIGPAEDGGYWLLGLSHEVDGVFEGVEWGTGVVFGQTMNRLTSAGIDPVLLPQLADCDRPEDLARWPELFTE
ncbi:MAG: TIGR04282 family arsenosugar biosynthesis glycosyltransferase [Sphingomonadales bacterium]|nr:TIGR04282 family arsenosugar biosynthesis glycosyltransferase [Sphingomonadales bacterium]